MASSTLDAGAKIYAGRVDSIYNDAYKVLGGLGSRDHSSKGEGRGLVWVWSGKLYPLWGYGLDNITLGLCGGCGSNSVALKKKKMNLVQVCQMAVICSQRRVRNV